MKRQNGSFQVAFAYYATGCRLLSMLWDAGRNLRKHLPPTFSQYDVVRVVSILDKSSVLVDAPNCRRPPKVGDLATILEVYRDPYGFELECCDSDGFTIWLGGYTPAQLLLEPHFPQN